jgi:hypothetical protein
MSLQPERFDASHDVFYLTKHPLYELALEKSAPITPDVGSQTPLVQVRFTAQAQQQGIRLPLVALEQFHDALSRLLDYVQQEHARRPILPLSGSSMEGSMASVVEQRHQHSTGDHPKTSLAAPGGEIEVAHAAAYPSRPVSVERLCSLSGIVLTAVIALLSWALYSLSPSQADFRPTQVTTAQETPPRTSTAAMLSTSDNASALRAPPVVGPFPSLSAATAKAPDEPPAQIYLHIQAPIQHKIAQRLAEQLQEKGYVIPKAAILEPKGPPRTEVRYFSPMEAEEATAIAMLVNQPYRAPATSSYIRGRKDASKAHSRRYEIWLGPEPRSPRNRH